MFGSEYYFADVTKVNGDVWNRNVAKYCTYLPKFSLFSEHSLDVFLLQIATEVGEIVTVTWFLESNTIHSERHPCLSSRQNLWLALLADLSNLWRRWDIKQFIRSNMTKTEQSSSYKHVEYHTTHMLTPCFILKKKYHKNVSSGIYQLSLVCLSVSGRRLIEEQHLLFFWTTMSHAYFYKG